MISVFVPGVPASQGSKKYLGRGVMVESCKRLPAWRSDIRSALLDKDGNPKATFSAGVHLEAEFVMPRPVSCPKTKTPEATKRPDADKMLRAVFDAIGSAGVWRDDAQVVSVIATKRLASLGETPGCHLDIMDAAAVQIEREDAVP